MQESISVRNLDPFKMILELILDSIMCHPYYLHTKVRITLSVHMSDNKLV